MFFLLHILLMGSATLGMIAGVSTAVFFRRKRNWLKIHKSVNLISLASAAAGIVIAYIYVAGSSGRHLDGLHQMAGLATFLIALTTVLEMDIQPSTMVIRSFMNLRPGL